MRPAPCYQEPLLAGTAPFLRLEKGERLMFLLRMIEDDDDDDNDDDGGDLVVLQSHPSYF